jgi:hypothetical protein
MELLRNHSKTETLSTFKTEKISSGGRPVEYAILDEQQATFLITLMRNSEKVILFKEELTKQFFKQRVFIQNLIMQQKDPSWMNVRKDGKQVYFQKTDVIKDFIEYAIKQGSKSAKMYYINFAKMENKALFIFEQKFPNLREVLTIRQLMQVSIADDIIEKAINRASNFISENISNGVYIASINEYLDECVELEGFAELIMAFIKISVPDLIWEEASFKRSELKTIEPINGWWNDELNVAFGYGLLQ